MWQYTATHTTHNRADYFSAIAVIIILQPNVIPYFSPHCPRPIWSGSTPKETFEAVCGRHYDPKIVFTQTWSWWHVLFSYILGFLWQMIESHMAHFKPAQSFLQLTETLFETRTKKNLDYALVELLLHSPIQTWSVKFLLRLIMNHIPVLGLLCQECFEPARFTRNT